MFTEFSFDSGGTTRDTVSDIRGSDMLRSSLAIAILVCNVGGSAYSQQTTSQARPLPQRVQHPVPFHGHPVPQSLLGSVWMTDASLKSSMVLKNSVLTSAIDARAYLHLSNGHEIALAPTHLNAGGTEIIDINKSLADNGVAPYAQLSGYVEVKYDWPWEALNGTIRNVDVAHSLLFNYPMTVNTPPSDASVSVPPAVSTSVDIEGMWWKETRDTGAFVALSNVGDADIDVALSTTLARRTLEQHSFHVPAHETKLVNIPEIKDDQSGSAGGISIKYRGDMYGLLVKGGLKDTATGYSENIPFVFASNSAPQARSDKLYSLAELGLMSGAADPMMAFPAGTTFRPYSVIRNVSQQDIIIQPTVYRMEGSTAQSLGLRPIGVPSGQTVALDVPRLMEEAGLHNYNGSLNLVLQVPEAVRTSLLFSAGSVDQKQTYVFAVWPAMVSPSSGRTVSYWSTGDGDDTMLTFWNPGDEVQNLLLTLHYVGGHYAFPLAIAPKATKALNISTLIKSGIPDAEGNVVPLSVHEGSAAISGSRGENEPIQIALDAATYNTRKATCGHYFITCDGVVSGGGVMNQDSVGLQPGDSLQQLVFGQWNTGTQYDETPYASWTSSDTTLASVDNTGTVNSLNSGQGTLSGSFRDSRYVTNYHVSDIPPGSSPYDYCPAAFYTGQGPFLPPLATCTCSAPIGPDMTDKCHFSCQCTGGGGVQYPDSQAFAAYYMRSQKSCAGLPVNTCPAVIESFSINLQGVGGAARFRRCVQVRPN